MTVARSSASLPERAMAGRAKPEDDPARKRRRKTEETRKLLVTSARDLIAEVGFREAQMIAVAARAGIAVGTVYRYFPAKSDLMVEVVGHTSQREVDVVAGIAMGDDTAQVRLGNAIWTFARRALQGRRLAHALMAEPVEPEVEAARLRYRRKLARVFETIIEQGIREGDFLAQNVQVAAACVVGSLFDGLLGALALDSLHSEADRTESAVALVDFCLRGISGRPTSFVAPSALS